MSREGSLDKIEWLEINIQGLDLDQKEGTQSHLFSSNILMIKDLWMEHTMKVDLNPPVKDKEDLMCPAKFIIIVE